MRSWRCCLLLRTRWAEAWESGFCNTPSPPATCARWTSTSRTPKRLRSTNTWDLWSPTAASWMGRATPFPCCTCADLDGILMAPIASGCAGVVGTVGWIWIFWRERGPGSSGCSNRARGAPAPELTWHGACDAAPASPSALARVRHRLGTTARRFVGSFGFEAAGRSAERKLEKGMFAGFFVMLNSLVFQASFLTAL